jgi:hypothetical protein
MGRGSRPRGVEAVNHSWRGRTGPGAMGEGCRCLVASARAIRVAARGLREVVPGNKSGRGVPEENSMLDPRLDGQTLAARLRSPRTGRLHSALCPFDRTHSGDCRAVPWPVQAERRAGAEESRLRNHHAISTRRKRSNSVSSSLILEGSDHASQDSYVALKIDDGLNPRHRPLVARRNRPDARPFPVPGVCGRRVRRARSA